MSSNLKVRIFDNANLFGQHQKRALGFLYQNSNDYRGESYIIRAPGENPADKIMIRGGDASLRWDIKTEFKALFGKEEPTFTQVFEHYSSVPGAKALYGKVLRYCCR